MPVLNSGPHVYPYILHNPPLSVQDPQTSFWTSHAVKLRGKAVPEQWMRLRQKPRKELSLSWGTAAHISRPDY
jgi:hypothetical protein